MILLAGGHSVLRSGSVRSDLWSQVMVGSTGRCDRKGPGAGIGDYVASQGRDDQGSESLIGSAPHIRLT